MLLDKCFCPLFYCLVEAAVEAHFVEIPFVKIVNIPEMVKAGDQVTIKCAASGVPKPKTRWLWQGMDVTSLNNSKVCIRLHCILHFYFK